MTMNLPEARPPAISLTHLFLRFLRFGALAFGGPVAQIAMIRQALVEEERWIDSARFNRLLAVMQVLPGPEAHELCVHLGIIARGRLGGLVAGLGFLLPGLILMLACAWAYTSFIAGSVALGGLLIGVQAAVLAIILRAVQRIASHILTNVALIGLAVLAFVGTAAGLPFWILLAAAGVAFAAFRNPAAIVLSGTLVSVIAWLALHPAAITNPAAVAAISAPVTVLALFVAGLKGGLLTFGGAYTAIPYVRDDTVGRGWLSDGAFLDGVAAAGLLPAPLVIFATFAGYVAGGLSGALAITVGMFLPAFAFSMLFFERLEAVVDKSRLHRLLDGVAAAVVGIIGATFVDLGASTVQRSQNLVFTTIIFIVAAIAAWRLKGRWVTPALIAFGAVAGLLMPT
ncbi:chromate efflux transporter [Croceibacterium sp. TMG7-5b_MA50]|uniref:chromate efflux transporter n=1 Tax=Croceibacterium sp. TMG7-5b_MA50 TaxID=3121290 RepID=UPI003221CA7A